MGAGHNLVQRGGIQSLGYKHASCMCVHTEAAVGWDRTISGSGEGETDRQGGTHAAGVWSMKICGLKTSTPKSEGVLHQLHYLFFISGKSYQSLAKAVVEQAARIFNKILSDESW